jgi:LysR family hydrogen peroxide-inducible transcriptional activator
MLIQTDAITLTQMRYALALERMGSFVRAARTCRVSQSTLSIQIQKVEDLLGQTLFDRSQKPIGPTLVGSEILKVFHKIVQETDQIPHILTNSLGKVTGCIRIGFIPTLAPLLIPRLVPTLRTFHPDLKVSASEAETAHLIESIRNSDLDAGLLADTPQLPWIKAHLLFEEEFVVYFSPEHQLLKEEYVQSEALSPDEAWLLSEGHCFGTQSLQLCTAHSRGQDDPALKQKRFDYEAGHFETLRMIVDHCGGFTFLPWLYCAVAGLSEHPNIRRFRPPAPARQVFYAHRADSPFTLTHASIRENIVEKALKPLLAQIKNHEPLGYRIIPYFS